MFQKELNAPMIEIMNAEDEATAPPATPENKPVKKNLNPFLNVVETSEEVESESAESMLLDDPQVAPSVSSTFVETNPFRRMSGDSVGRSTVAGDGNGGFT